MKKKRIFMISVFILIATLIIFFFTRVKNYMIEYDVDNFHIKESFDKELDSYHFELTNSDHHFDIVSKNKYIRKKKLIENITLFEDEETKEFCIYPKSSKVEVYPLCSKNGKLLDFNLLERDTTEFYERPKVKTETGTYKNVKSNATNGRRFLVWAHKGYYSLTGEKLMDNSKEDLSPMFLKNESYYNKLAYQMDEYVLTPDYDQEFAFDKFYVFDFKKGSLTEWKLDFEISYNSYYLGDLDGIIYIFDRKNETEYALNPKKESAEIVSKDKMGKVFLTDWKEVSTTKLLSTEYSFEKKQNYTYSIKDDQLVLQFNGSNDYITVSNKKPDKIVSQKDDRIYYLIKDELYEYSLKYGEIHLLTYSEWAFNSLNSIYIY